MVHIKVNALLPYKSVSLKIGIAPQLLIKVPDRISIKSVSLLMGYVEKQNARTWSRKYERNMVIGHFIDLRKLGFIIYRQDPKSEMIDKF
jgi:hypothetical protein